MKDFLGNELEIGDNIIFVDFKCQGEEAGEITDASLKKGIISDFGKNQYREWAIIDNYHPFSKRVITAAESKEIFKV